MTVEPSEHAATVEQPVRLTDLAERTGISLDTLYDLARAGDLPAFKLGVAWYVRAADWSAFLAARAGADAPAPAPAAS